LIEASDEVRVLKLDGWQRSVGVQAEIALARTLSKPVRLTYPRSVCDRCGQQIAHTARGLWPHHCQGLLPTIRPGDVLPAA